MKIPDEEINEENIELTKDQIKELKSRIKDLENKVRYVIYSEILPKGRWRLFLNISDDTWCDDLETATLFKREHIAKAVVEKYSEGKHRDLCIAKVTTKGIKRMVLKYFR